MANTNSTIVTNHATSKTAGRLPLDPMDCAVVLKHIRSRVTCPATPSTSDTLTLVPKEIIPVGARLAPADSWVYCVTDPGTALTLDIGTASDPDSLADALALTTAATTGGRVGFHQSGTVPVGISAPITVATQEDIIATIVTSTSVSQTVIEFCIAYFSAE